MNGSLHFADLVMILDSFKRGDYWAAAGRAIATINSFFNGPGPLAAGPGPMSATAMAGVGGARFAVGGSPSQEDWDNVLSELEGVQGVADGAGDGMLAGPNPDPTRLDNPQAGISPAAISMIVQLLLEVFRGFRNRGVQGEQGESTLQAVKREGTAAASPKLPTGKPVNLESARQNPKADAAATGK
jgi:hypothetical protein